MASQENDIRASDLAFVENYKHTWLDGSNTAATVLLAHLVKRQLREDDQFNRGVLIAVATLINCWGHGTETAHLLKMIDATPAMVERMDFTDYDRDPLLAALSDMKVSA